MTCNHIVHAVHGHGAMCIGPTAETPCVRMPTFSLCVRTLQCDSELARVLSFCPVSACRGSTCDAIASAVLVLCPPCAAKIALALRARRSGTQRSACQRKKTLA